MYNFDPYNILLAISTNIPVLLKTGFVLQGHVWVKDKMSHFGVCIKFKTGFYIHRKHNKSK